MDWFKLILVLLFGILPNLVVIAVIIHLINDLKKEASSHGEIKGYLKHIQSMVARQENKKDK